MENNKLFVYGILKRGYEADLAKYGATFLGEAEIPNATLFGIGPPQYWHTAGPYRAYSGVGLRLDEGPEGKPLGAKGELWEIPDALWKWLDGIESNGFCYTRKLVKVQADIREENIDGPLLPYEAWVYEHTYPGFNYDNPIEGGVF